MGAYLQCSKNKVYCCYFFGLLLYAHGGIWGKHYTLMDLTVHCEEIEPILVFVASLSCELSQTTLITCLLSTKFWIPTQVGGHFSLLKKMFKLGYLLLYKAFKKQIITLFHLVLGARDVCCTANMKISLLSIKIHVKVIDNSSDEIEVIG